MPRRSVSGAAKQATNVSIRRDLVAAAREAGINLSETLERALEEELIVVRQKKWLSDNKQAIAAYNDYVEKHGVFSEDQRSF